MNICIGEIQVLLDQWSHKGILKKFLMKFLFKKIKEWLQANVSDVAELIK
jgi:hypothetical protein